MQQTGIDRPSLESIVEVGMLPLKSLHPGGLRTTRRLAEQCHIHQGARVLDVASGTGETACFLAEAFGAHVYGIDRSQEMVRRAEDQARARNLQVQFRTAEAASLPFDDSIFDAAICECTLCFLDKPRVLGEMVRVVHSGGCVGMHDLCWRAGASVRQKRTLADVEGEEPETLDGWQRLFERAGLIEITVIDLSAVKSRWMDESSEQLGLTGLALLVLNVVRRWGLRGLSKVLRSQSVFASDRLGYGLVVGTKR